MTVRSSFVELRDRLESLMIGQDGTVVSLLVGLLADGQILLESAAGLAKTRIARLPSPSLTSALSM